VPRINIRRRNRSDRSLTAAASRVTDPSKAFTSSLGSGSDKDGGWQAKAWAALDQVGELRYYVGWRSASASRCRLVASDIDPDTGLPTGSTDNETVAQIVRDIAGGVAGQSQLIKRMTVFLTVPGEGWAAMIVRDNEDGSTTEEWVTLSRDEIVKSQKKLEFTLDDGSKHEFDPSRDILVRIWNPHPRRAREADSPTNAALPILNEIIRATVNIDNASKSRLIGNGIVFLPQEMSLPKQAPAGTAPVPVGSTPPPSTDAPQWEQASSQDLQDLLYQIAKTAYEDQDSMAALLPIFAQVPGEHIKDLNHLKFDSPISETSLKTREAAIRRLAMSLDVSPERLLGLGNNSNHWSAWAIGEDDVKIHIVPVLETIASALTGQVFRAALEAEGIDPDLYTVWYDTAALTQDPDRKDEARDAWDRGALSTEAYLEYLGFSTDDGYDLTTLAGWQQLARDKVADDPTLLPLMAPLLGVAEVAALMPAEAEPVGAEVVPVDGAAPVSTAATDELAAQVAILKEQFDALGVAIRSGVDPDDAARRVGLEGVKFTGAIPTTLRPAAEVPDGPPGSQVDTVSDTPAEEDVTASAAPWQVFGQAMVNRALELANKRRRTRQDHASLAAVPLHEVQTRMPSMTADAARAAIRGWDDAVPAAIVRRMGMDPDRFAVRVEAVAVAALTASSRAVF
jgi:hypothetical protein